MMRHGTETRTLSRESKKSSTRLDALNKMVISYPLTPIVDEVLDLMDEVSEGSMDTILTDVTAPAFAKVFIRLLFEYIITKNVDVYVALEAITSIHTYAEDYNDALAVQQTFMLMAEREAEVSYPLFNHYIPTMHYVYLELAHDCLMVTLTPDSLPERYNLIPITNPTDRQLERSRRIYTEYEYNEPIHPPEPANTQPTYQPPPTYR